MTRHLLPISFAARRIRKGDHLKVTSLAVGSQRDLMAEPQRPGSTGGRARLINFRRAILG